MASGTAGSADLYRRSPVLHLGDTYRDEPVKARQADDSLIVVKEQNITTSYHLFLRFFFWKELIQT